MSTIYDVAIIENQIEQIAMLNDGEIDESLLQQLIESEMRLPVQIEGLIHYIKHLEGFEIIAKAEEERIKNKRKAVERRIESIKKYMTPLIELKGKMEIGTFTLSIRKSESVEISDGFIDNAGPEYINYKEVITRTPDKDKIKKAIKIGKIVPGAILKENLNLQIK